MKNFFDKRFDEEFLVSEKLRTTILACIFLAGTVFASVGLFVFEENGSDEFRRGSIWRIFFFQSSLLLFELLSLLYIRRRIKKKLRSIPVWLQYLNIVIEISAPAVMMLLLAQQYIVPSGILHSPIINVYFIFIILSTLRLNFRLTIFAGILAATSYFSLSFYLIHQSGARAQDMDEYVIAGAKSIGLLVGGVGAAFVARQIRLSINRSLVVAEKANRVVNLFGQQISKEVVEEMLMNEGNLQSRMMNVSIMFIDIRNFTKYVLDKTPVEIVKYQNAFFSIVVNAITKHHGIVNQFLGDGCMVTFGAPAPLSNPGEHAVKAALEIQQKLKIEIEKGNIPSTQIGIGIHTGDAVTGNIGNTERQQYSITGNVVILASRIEQLNKEYNSQILISEEVKRSTTEQAISKSVFLGRVSLKGWSKPVGIYKVA